MWREIKKIIHQKNNFLLTTHVNPDGDGIGAASAFTELLFRMGKNVRFVCDSHIPEKFSFLDYHGVFSSFDPAKDYGDVQVLAVLDTHRKDRIGRLSKIIDEFSPVSICIDHHVPTEIFTPLSAIDPKACSAGAMVYTLYKEFGYELDQKAATGIYTSVICDTGRFCYSSTSRKAHKIADECIKLGVDPDLMYSRLFQHVPLGQIRMFASALQRMEAYFDNHVVIQEIRKVDYPSGDSIQNIENIDLEYIHEFNKLIENVECVVLLRELDDGHVRVSMRSNSCLDIGKIMRGLGGGGHSKAAGMNWNGSLESIKAKILNVLGMLYQPLKKS